MKHYMERGIKMAQLPQLEAFLLVAREGHFSRAAEKLHISQPAITARIQLLEKEVGFPLFSRTTRRVELTAKGKKLLQYVETALQQLSEGLECISDDKEILYLRVISSPTIASYWMPLFMKHLREINSALHVNWSSTSRYEEIVAFVADELADAGMVNASCIRPQDKLPSSLKIFHILDDPYVFIAGNNFLPPTVTSLRLRDLCGIPQVAFTTGTRFWYPLQELYDRYGVRPNIISEMDDFEGIKQAVMSNLATAFVPYSIARDEIESGLVVKLSVEEVNLVRKVGVIYKKEKEMDWPVKSFINAAETVRTSADLGRLRCRQRSAREE
ncbi:MAG: LysR family transcriptional regulator [Clostridia bacterium]|nr:MAG: LysR family transcriptional regulator [Clostridia bacterium]